MLTVSDIREPVPVHQLREETVAPEISPLQIARQPGPLLNHPPKRSQLSHSKGMGAAYTAHPYH